MAKRLATGWALLFVVITIAYGAAAAQYPVTVTSIVIDGIVEIPEKDVLDVIEFAAGDSVYESDLKAASQAVYDLGWFGEVLPSVSNDGAMTFSVTEYPVIGEIEITGNDYRVSYDLFGITLFRLPIVATSKMKQILRQHDVKPGEVLNRVSLQEALVEIQAVYSDRGYILVTTGDIAIGETLAIEIVEGRVGESRIEGLETIPLDVVEPLIRLPQDEPLQLSDYQAVGAKLRDGIWFSSIDVTPQASAVADEVVLVWTLEERKLTDELVVFDEIRLVGVTRLPEDVAYSRLGEVPDGEVDNYGLLCIFNDLYKLYSDAGYFMVRFTVTSIEDGILTVGVEEGIISEIVISGNTRTLDNVITNNLELQVGQILTTGRAQVAYQKLYSLGYFGAVNIVPEWQDDGVHVTVSVTEKDQLGGMDGAVAFEPATCGLVGELSISQKNLFGTGQNISLSYSRGLSTEIEPLTSTWTLGYKTVAYFPGFDAVGVNLYREFSEVPTDDETLTYLTLGGEVSFKYPIMEYTQLGLSYKHEDERLAGTDDWEPIDAVTLSISYDDTNSPYFATEGDLRAFSLEQAGGFAAGKEYTRLSTVWIRYTPLYMQLLREYEQVFAMRLKATWTKDELSLTRASTLGGITTIRGTESRTADQVFISNFEYRLELTGGLVLTWFLDAGIDLESVCMENALASTGLEIGITAAGVQVRLDIAWVLGENASWVPRFDVGFGSMF